MVRHVRQGGEWCARAAGGATCPAGVRRVVRLAARHGDCCWCRVVVFGSVLKRGGGLRAAQVWRAVAMRAWLERRGGKARIHGAPPGQAGAEGEAGPGPTRAADPTDTADPSDPLTQLTQQAEHA